MKSFFGAFFMLIAWAIGEQEGFLQDQKRYPRVREALQEKETFIAENLSSHEMTFQDFHLLLVAYKAEDVLELHAKSKTGQLHKLIATYGICERSGALGPKRKQGDYQVPEGFYQIDRFNPASSFHLSLGLNYPNDADRRKSKFDQLGGDIFIHGDCVTIGCLPMTDDKIKEIYVYALHAKNNGQARIPVYVFPFRMTDENMITYGEKYQKDLELVDFWQQLKPGYDQFAAEKEGLRFTVNPDGDYIF